MKPQRRPRSPRKSRLAAEQARKKPAKWPKSERTRPPTRGRTGRCRGASRSPSPSPSGRSVGSAEQAEQQAAADRFGRRSSRSRAAPPDAPPKSRPSWPSLRPRHQRCPPALAATATCPQCQHTVGDDDMFCGERRTPPQKLNHPHAHWKKGSPRQPFFYSSAQTAPPGPHHTPPRRNPAPRQPFTQLPQPARGGIADGPTQVALLRLTPAQCHTGTDALAL